MITSSPTDPPGNIDVSMIGAGIIGLAIAKSLAEKGQTVTALEQERCYGSGDSSRNSEWFTLVFITRSIRSRPGCVWKASISYMSSAKNTIYPTIVRASWSVQEMAPGHEMYSHSNRTPSTIVSTTP